MTDGPELRVRAVVVDDDRLLMVRRGRGVAAGRWGVPGSGVQAGELMAEAVVRAVYDQTGVEGVCGASVAISEDVGDGRTHQVVVAYAVTLLQSAEPRAGGDVTEARWVALGDVIDLALVPGLAELLYDQAIITTIV